MGHKLRLLRLAFWLCNSSAAGSCIFFFSNQECGPICILLRWAPIPLQLTYPSDVWDDEALRWTWLWELHLRGFQWSWILAVEPGWHVETAGYFSSKFEPWYMLWPWHDPWFAEARFVHILAPTVGIACFLVRGLKRFEAWLTVQQKSRWPSHWPCVQSLRALQSVELTLLRHPKTS